MAKKQGLYSDLDEFIEEGGRHDVEKDVKQEGNIPPGKPKEGENPSHPISSSDSRPESPQREGNIQPSAKDPDEPQRQENIQGQGSATPEAAPETPQRQPIDPKKNSPEAPSEAEGIPVSDQAPEEPQRRGNIQPRQFNPKKGQIERDAKEGAEPESPRRKENIRPDESNRPDNPNQVSRQPREEAAPNEPNQESRAAKTGAQPQKSNQASRQARDEATPGSPNRSSRGPRNAATRSSSNQNRREPKESAKPKSPNQNQRSPRENAAPQKASQNQRTANEESRPQTPQRRVINLREAAAPSSPSQRGNIQPSEEPPTTEPTEGADIDVSAENQPPQSEQTENIKSEDRRPESPQREENIGTEENAAPQEPSRREIPQEETAPQEPSRSKIEAEENKPKSPNASGNILPAEESDPSSPNRSGNINPPEEPKPKEASQENNIPQAEQSQPPSPDQGENIQPAENPEPAEPRATENIPGESSKPKSPQKSGNISPTENPNPEPPNRSENISSEEGVQPPSAQSSGDISPQEEATPQEPSRSEIEAEENKPQSAQSDGNIQPTEESDPSRPNRSGNISPTESPKPQEASKEGNISPEEESTPSEPNSSGSISPTEESEPGPPKGQENISPGEELGPEFPNASDNISPTEDSQPEEPNREQNIEPTEDSEPSSPQGSNITPKEDSKPEEPNRSENINPTEGSELESTGENIDPREDIQPSPPEVEGNISPTEGSEPSEPSRENNISPSEETQPEQPSRKSAISPTEGSEPSEPSREDNISPTEESEPSSPESDGAIDPTEESEPSAPNRDENISPTEESEPEESSKEGNIDPPEDSEPASPDSDGAIDPTEESEPDQPQRENNISPTEESEPSEPDRDGAIDPTEGSEPSEPDQDGFISPTEESELEEPQKEGNIDPSDKETTDGTGSEPLSKPKKEGNIDPTDAENTDGIGGEKLSEPQRQGNIDPSNKETTDGTGTESLEEPQKEGNIDPTNAEKTDGVGGEELPEPQREGNIDPTDSENTDGIGGEEIEREQPLKFQPARFSSQIDPEDVDFVDSVAGSEDGAPEWEPPLRYQLEIYADQIDPADEGGKYQLERFVAGSDEPGGDIRDMEYGNEGATGKLRFQNVVEKALDSGTIDPSFEDGVYSLPNFVAGSDEPGGNVRDMAYDQGGANEELHHQPPNIQQKLQGGTIINPEDEGGRYQLDQFVAGSDEPGDDIRDMEYGIEGASETPRHQPENIRQKLRSNAIINPEDEGGGYQLEEFVAGANEPGENILEMPDSESYEWSMAFQSDRFKGQIDPESGSEFREDFGDTFPGEDNSAPEWEVPLRHHTERFADQIDPADEGGKYQLEGFVAGSDEPGGDIRDMTYGNEGASEELRFQKAVNQALDNGTIDPSFERGQYLLPEFVAGNNEPGDNVRDMAYDQDGASEGLRHQPENIQQKLRASTIINPADEGGRYQLEQFVAGSDEPGSDIRDMGYDFSQTNAPLRHQPQNIQQKLRDGGVIDSSDEGGRYQLEQFVAGSNEPGDQFSQFGSAGRDPQGESAFGAESSHGSNGPVLNPAFNNLEPKQVELVLQNERVSVITEGAFPQSENGIEERNEPLEHQSKQLEGQINPRNPDTTDGVGGNFKNSENATIEANETEEFQTRFQGEIEDLNRTIRLRQFDNLFGDGRTDLPVGDTPIPRAEFTLASIGPDQPLILRRPESGGGSSLIANAKQADSRIAPAGSAAEDAVRMSKFFATGKGITYNIKQQFLQIQNPRTRTRIYDPTSPIQASASGMAIRPGQGITRHLSADSGPFGLIGDATSAIGDAVGLDFPQSSRYEDELEEEAINTEWGEMTGSLFWLSPVAQRALPDVTGEGARTRIKQIRSGNLQNVKPLFSTSGKDQLSQFAAAALGRQGGIGNGYLFTNTYDPQGGPGGEGREETDNYHPSVPYIRNVDSVNSRRKPTGSAYVSPEFTSPGDQLRALITAARNAKDSVFPFINSDATPSTDNITDGRGNVIAQRQNDTTSEVYYENRVIERGGDRIPVHRGVQQKENHGLPNYSKKNRDGEKINRIDWINRLEPIIGKGADPEQETFGEGQHRDLIPFKFYDIENEGLIVFRAFLEGISDNLSPDWSQQEYTGRPEQGHIYGGYSNTISFSFQVAPFSKEEFKAQWKKINYLKGLTTPSGYNVPTGGGGYMTPPFMRMTIGDMFNDVYGYMNSLTISVNDDMDWEIDEEVGRLPRGIEVDVDWQVIEKRAPLALQKYYDAPFIGAIEEPTRESPEPKDEILPKSADETLEKPGIDTDRAIEQAKASNTETSEGSTVNPEDTTPFLDISRFRP